MHSVLGLSFPVFTEARLVFVPGGYYYYYLHSRLVPGGLPTRKYQPTGLNLSLSWGTAKEGFPTGPSILLRWLHKSRFVCAHFTLNNFVSNPTWRVIGWISFGSTSFCVSSKKCRISSCVISSLWFRSWMNTYKQSLYFWDEVLCTFLHFSDYCLYLCRHVYHIVSAVVRSSLHQVVGMSNLTPLFRLLG